MAIELYDYQRDLLDQVQAALEGNSKARVLMQLPTGGGKTEIAGVLLANWFSTHPNNRAVWLTHREHLQEQTYQRLAGTEASPIKVGTWPRGPAPATSGHTTILSASTVGRRAEMIRKTDTPSRKGIWDNYTYNDLMIIDEAHHAAARNWETAMSQWPGRIAGVTATPWRLGKDSYLTLGNLFPRLIRGPQVSTMQSGGWLCEAVVWMPSEEDQIRGGRVGSTGEFSEPGIERANRDRPDVMTGGAFRFWKDKAYNRQTIVYAASRGHAHNLAAVFNDAGIPAAVILADTSTTERSECINRFERRDLKVLINVAVATEGFDLPDAACVVLARPTMSLGLYLQMVGRGLRRKRDGGDCLVMDLAANSERHGLPNDNREWNWPPGTVIRTPTAPPTTRCEECGTVSPSSSHNCVNTDCGAPFGQICGRCGSWRAWMRWSLANDCQYRQEHDLVCDLCHWDAHILLKLPNDGISEPDPAIKDLETRIAHLESMLCDDNELSVQFKEHLESLAQSQRPSSEAQSSRAFVAWEQGLHDDLDDRRAELARLLRQ